nr:actin-like protein 8 [Odocoileus virginianus texanus]XP_020754909.1 actin-like protein 8 [Odocoileus virginianus texanus]XP_020754910.1 actin-like protein 8 [Odocoileus virginianus texanus]XP_020754911.1 actin-like protein 8 [Odocoileus virginianus texanus]XP_020754912.1 actin-like protein 8 [Odocoileus virginianus texanus]XP_020754913.1 actin-like protein 8 [Odocoileus virginianus texanus]XP_020754914.1 actin-like protein 8 [Odocoileus virginianus texanus]XP_020754916.1 actin-like protei
MSARSIIIDHGSAFLKAGLSGWNEPQLVLPSVVNYIPCQENPGPSYARRRVSLGIDICRPDTFSYPVQRGRVINWEGVEHIWSFILQRHRLEHEDLPVIITESPLKEPADRQKTLEIMFELLGVPSVLLADQREMSLYASGLLTGVVVDSGCGLTRVQPFHLGRPLWPGAKTLEFAGQDLSAYLFKSLFKEAYNRHNLFQLDTVASTQMYKCYVPLNLGEELEFYQSLPHSADRSNSYQLPDGTPVELTAMQRLAPEMFFSPQVFNLQGPSLPQAVVESIEACEPSLRPLLTSHVVPCGGNTLYPGFTTRLYQLVASHFSSTRASVFAGSNRHFSVWLGASVVAHLSTYKSEWLTKEEYSERFRM